MWYKYLGLATVLLFINKGQAWATPNSLVLDKPVLSISPLLMSSDQPVEGDLSKGKAPAKPAEDVQQPEPAKTAAKAPSFWERATGFFGKVASFVEPAKAFANEFLKQTGATDLGEKLKEIGNGYYNLTLQADKDYKTKQQARIDRGEQHGPVMSTLLKGWDLTTSAVVPSFVYSMNSWGLPLIKAVIGMPNGKEEKAKS